MKNKIQTISVLKVIAAIILFWALADHPYYYYQLLRWLTCGTAIYCGYQAYLHKQIAWPWIFGIIAVLFNPIAPFYFHKEIWSVFNVITGVIFLVSIFNFKQKKQVLTPSTPPMSISKQQREKKSRFDQFMDYFVVIWFLSLIIITFLGYIGLIPNYNYDALWYGYLLIIFFLFIKE